MYITTDTMMKLKLATTVVSDPYWKYI